MAKTLTIQIKPAEDVIEGFREAFKGVEPARRLARHDGVYLTSIEAARNLLTPNRLALLRTIRNKRPRLNLPTR
jgi:predicted transcriptional regulator